LSLPLLGKLQHCGHMMCVVMARALVMAPRYSTA
jgi:hypothetical protein